MLLQLLLLAAFNNTVKDLKSTDNTTNVTNPELYPPANSSISNGITNLAKTFLAKTGFFDESALIKKKNPRAIEYSTVGKTYDLQAGNKTTEMDDKIANEVAKNLLVDIAFPTTEEPHKDKRNASVYGDLPDIKKAFKIEN